MPPHIWKPAQARLLTIDSFIPVPRGTTAAAPAPLAWPAKDPADVLDYQLDISPALTGNKEDVLATVDISIVPDGAGDVIVSNVSVDGPRVIVWFAGGQNATVYTVTVLITTAGGRTIQRSVLLPVLSLSVSNVPQSSLLTNSGSAVVDQHGNPILVS